MVLSLFNAVYSGVLSGVLLYDLLNLRKHHLMRSFSIGEAFSKEYGMLLSWLDTYTSIIFFVRQLAWPCMFWHVYVAYIFLAITRRTNPVSALQRKFPRILLCTLLGSGLCISLEICSYKEWLAFNPLILEVLVSSICLCVVVCIYMVTCIALLRHTSWNMPNLVNLPHVTNLRNQILVKLIVILAAFILVWSWVVGNTFQVSTYK